jgi:transcriptional regulator with XRE-family HTH domain
MDLREVFAINLRRLRYAKGLSQDDRAYEAEVSRSYLSQLEKGAFYASLRIVGKIAAAPTFLIRDNDCSWRGIRAAGSVDGLRDRPIAPRSPWQNGYVERAIGSIRRECLDHMIVWSEAHLRRVLKDTLLITTRHGPISACRKMPPIADPLSAAAASSLATSWVDFTINTVGFSFRKRQRLLAVK